MADESYPEDLKYHREHDWVRVEDGETTFGVTWFAQEQLGEVVFAELPEVGDTVSANETYGALDSNKASSEVFAPASGEVLAVNDEVVGDPSLVNEDPYGRGWLLRVKLSDPSELDELLDAAAYRRLVTPQ